jgi:cohesin loading factor subunit SCC2
MPSQSDEGVVQEVDTKEREDEENEDEEKPASNTSDTSGLDGCDAVCNQFTSQILQRCYRKGEEGGASEFRPILSNLIDDLLHVRFMIEFPAAEMLLLSLSHRVSALQLVVQYIVIQLLHHTSFFMINFHSWGTT